MIVLILMVRLDLFLDNVLGEILDPKHYIWMLFWFQSLRNFVPKSRRFATTAVVPVRFKVIRCRLSRGSFINFEGKLETDNREFCNDLEVNGCNLGI